MRPLVDKTDFVVQLKTAQLIVMVIGIISGIMLGIILSYMELQNLRGKDIACIAGEGEEERKRIKKIKKTWNYFFKCVQIPFQIWAIILTALAKTLFADIADETCSDAETQSTIEFLSKTLNSTYSSNISAIAILFVSLLIDLLLAAWERRKKAKETQPIKIQSKNDKEDDIALQHNSTARLDGSYVKSPELPMQQQQPNSGGSNIVIQLQQMPQPTNQFNPQYPQPQYGQPQFGQPQYAPQQYPQQQFAPQQFAPQQFPPQQQFAQPEPQANQPVSFNDRFAKRQAQNS
jgi:hypothetical protein